MSPSPADSAPDPKADLRRSLRARRKALSAGDRARAAEAVANHLTTLLDRHRKPGTPPGILAGYHPVGSELDPRPALRRARAAGWRIALPVVTAPDAPLIFRAWPETGNDVTGDDLNEAALIDSAHGRVPPDSAPRLDPDIILVPLLGFDDTGGRLGQGGGFYDRTLAARRRGHPPLAIGLAFDCQRLPHLLPAEDHDQPLDGCMTEVGIVWFER